MKQLFLLSFTFGLFACNRQGNNTQVLQNRVDSLEMKLADAYKPGFGEFMSSIQVHHNKLWFAAQNQNWKLADFEIHEIMENINAIKMYQKERKETEHIDMIAPVLDSINAAINQKDPVALKKGYLLLTNTCNNCHRATGFGFNVVKIPDTPPFSNQDFKPQNGE